ncbi:MAG: hypothetical protein LBL39_05330 [Planctomycetaceae bacterium]|jgi:hypothetical protein|nr:hypothetical protein [Planctomycetaceae bacterium]
MDNPVQVKRSTGVGNLLNRNCVAVQLVHGKDKFSLLNCYAVPCVVVELPRAALRLHGVIHVKVLRTWECLLRCFELSIYVCQIFIGKGNHGS